jgi:hypothetical protein
VVKVKSTQFKLGAATLGTSALLAMGAIGVAGGVSSAQDETEVPPPGPITTSEITTGETAVDTAAPDAPITTVATPEVTAEPAPTG